MLEQNAFEAPRRLTLRHLTAAESALDRLEDQSDTQALHDFRVSMRRIRTYLRVFRPQLKKAVSGRLRRRLKALSAASGESRDTEVQLAWLNEQLPGLSRRQRIGTRWLMARLEKRRQEGDLRFRAEVNTAFPSIQSKLQKGLSVYTLTVSLDGSRFEQSFAEILALEIPRLIDELGRHITTICLTDDQAAVHLTRIAGKRLRYVLEAIEVEMESAATMVRELKEFQNALGDLHDSHIFAGELALALEDTATETARYLSASITSGEHNPAALKQAQRTDPRGGLLALAERLRSRRNAAYSTIESRWLGQHANDFLARLREVSAQLEEARNIHEEFYPALSGGVLTPPIFVQSTFPTMPASTAAKLLRSVSDASREVT